MSSIPSVFTIPFSFPNIPGVGCAFSTRLGGHSSSPFDRANISFDVGDNPEMVLRNRMEIKTRLDFTWWQEAKQVHGVNMLFDPEPTSPNERAATEADGLATAEPGQALVIKTADCQPILLAHESGRHIAALHVGWRGNVAGFPTLGVKAFCERYSLKPSEILAVRGPSLGPGAACFENFNTEFGESFSDYFNTESRCMDLWHLTRQQLATAGLKPQNIFGLDLCTYSLPDYFFSYRRSQQTGRQASIIWIKKS